MSDNSWYEKGELPPVGTVCEAKFSSLDDYKKVGIVKHKDNVAACYMFDEGWNLAWSSKFRPIKSDREKAIEEMKDIICVEGAML